MEVEFPMRIAPFMVAVCPNHAPRLNELRPTRLTFSLQVPVTIMVEPGPALGRAALMLEYVLGFTPEQSTNICARRPTGKSKIAKSKNLCQAFIKQLL